MGAEQRSWSGMGFLATDVCMDLQLSRFRKPTETQRGTLEYGVKFIDDVIEGASQTSFRRKPTEAYLLARRALAGMDPSVDETEFFEGLKTTLKAVQAGAGVDEKTHQQAYDFFIQVGASSLNHLHRSIR